MSNEKNQIYTKFGSIYGIQFNNIYKIKIKTSAILSCDRPIQMSSYYNELSLFD